MDLILNPTQEDYEKLWQANPLAREQLKSIVLGRMYGDLVEEVKRLRDSNDFAEATTPAATAEVPNDAHTG